MRRGFGMGLLIGLLIALIAGLVTYIVATRHRGTRAAGSPKVTTLISPTPQSSPSSQPSSSPNHIRSEVSQPFNKLGPVEGAHLSLGVYWLPTPNSLCFTHTYSSQGHTHAAFYSDCSNWQVGYDILFFYVGIRNETHSAHTYRLDNFILSSRDGRSSEPINVRSQANRPPDLLPQQAKIPPKGALRGWLTFDGRVQGLVPSRLSYVDGKQTLTETFEGGYHVVPRSG
jgi:hypothetical protein